MSTPLVDRTTGDVIPASDHNDTKDYIEDAAYRINTLAIEINGTEIVDSARLGTFADLVVDTDTLYVDKANHYVGIGLLDPDEALQVKGTINVGDVIGFKFSDETDYAKIQTGSQDLSINPDGNDVIIGATSGSAKLNIIQTGNNDALFINQDGEDEALYIDGEQTTANGVTIDLDTLTSGYGLKLSSSSSGFSGSGGFAQLELSDAAATGKVFVITNAGTGDACYIDQNGDGAALDITTAATDSNALSIVSDAEQVTGNLVVFNQSNAATITDVINLTNVGTGDAIHINQDGDGVCLDIDSDASTAKIIDIDVTSNSSDGVITLTTANSGGRMLNIVNSGIRTGGDAGIYFSETDGSTDQILMELHNEGSGVGAFINQDGDADALSIDSEAGTSSSLIIDQAIDDTYASLSISHGSVSKFSVYRNDSVNNDVALTLGDVHLWMSSAGDLRFKTSAPTSDSDGDIISATTPGDAITWTEVTSTSQAGQNNYGYICNNGSRVTVTLPATADVGKFIRISGKGSGGWKVAQNASQNIEFGNLVTTTGVSGYLESTNEDDCLELLCTVSDTTWTVLSSIGSLTVV